MCFMFYKLLPTEYIKSLLEMIVYESLIQTHNSEKQIACWTHYARYIAWRMPVEENLDIFLNFVQCTTCYLMEISVSGSGKHYYKRRFSYWNQMYLEWWAIKSSFEITCGFWTFKSEIIMLSLTTLVGTLTIKLVFNVFRYNMGLAWLWRL